ncbi:MAG: hypothetical protein ACI8ZN_002084 [Bacteroidia bacterium]|jgi:hypothetical protein
MIKTSFLHIPILSFFVGIVLLTSCKKSEEIALGNSGLIALSSHSGSERVSIQSTSDGGFLVVSHTRRNQDQDISIMQFNEDLVLQWERLIGGKFDDKMEHVFIDRDQNIFIAGFAFGFGQDTLRPRLSRDWLPYFHLLSASGTTLWETTTLFQNYNKSNQNFTDVAQDPNGNYLVSGKISVLAQDTNGNFFGANRFPTIVKIEADGTKPRLFIRSFQSAEANIEAIVQVASKTYAFGHGLVSNSQAEYYTIDPGNVGGMDRCKTIDTLNWRSDAQLSNPLIATLIKQESDLLHSFVINRNLLVRYTLQISTKKMAVEIMPMPFRDVTWAGQDANAFMFATESGWIYETDSELKLTNSFHSNYPIKQICKRKDGGYNAVIYQGDVFFLARLNEKGQVVDHE